MSWLFDDDITWCADGSKCKYKNCFRNLCNRKRSTDVDIFTVGSLMNTPDCVYYQEEIEKKEEKSFCSMNFGSFHFVPNYR